MKKKISVLSLALGLLLSANTTSLADEGWYCGIDFVSSTINGDFDGTSGYSSGMDVIIVPDIDPGRGFALRLGYALPTNVSIEAMLSRTSHDSVWLGIDFDVSHIELGVDLKYLFKQGSATRPYLKAGLGVHILEVEGGASNGFALGDAIYTGSGLSAGLGVEYFMQKNLSFDLGATFKIVSYNEGEGVSYSGELNPELDGNGVTLSMGLAYHF